MICINDALQLSQPPVIMMADIPQRLAELLTDFAKSVALKKE
jgi:hypothetical protein